MQVMRYAIIITTIARRLLSFDISKSCLDLRPHYLIDVASSRQPHRLPPGVSLVYDVTGQVHSYRMTSRMGTLSFPSDAIFDKCDYFPQEFSIFITLKYNLEPDPHREECILSIKSTNIKSNYRFKKHNTSIKHRKKSNNNRLPKNGRQSHHTKADGLKKRSTQKQRQTSNKKSRNGQSGNRKVQPIINRTVESRKGVKNVLLKRKTLLSVSVRRSKLLIRYNNTFSWFALYELFDEQWHSIAVSITGNTMVVTQDCRMRQRKTFHRSFPAKLDISSSDVFVGSCSPHDGTTTALLKNVILLPESDASARACGTSWRLDESHIGQSRIVVYLPGKSHHLPVVQHTECMWTDVGYLTYDIHRGIAMVCVNGVWKPFTGSSDRRKRLDYVREHQTIRTPAPAIDIEIFRIPGQGLFAAFSNSGTNSNRNAKSSTNYGRRGRKGVTETRDDYATANNVLQKNAIDNKSLADAIEVEQYNTEISSKLLSILQLKYRNINSSMLTSKFKVADDRRQTSSRDTKDGAKPRTRGSKPGKRTNVSGRSVIFKWQDNKFRFYQYIESNTAQCMKFFRIGSQYFLAVANYGLDTDTSTESVIYRWHRKKRKFRRFQSLVTWTARDFEYFSFNKEHYLAVANYAKRGHTMTDSVIYKWNKSNRQFDEYQRIATVGAYDWTFIRVDGYYFLAGADAFNGITTKLFSVIYFWQNEKFVRFQTLETNGATDFEVFTIDDVIYLAVANAYNFGPQNFRNKQTYLTNSTIYRLDRSKRQFEYFQHMQTSSAIDWEYFSIGKDHYLLLSNAQNDKEAQKTSSIYRFRGVEGFVLTNELKTYPTADWEVFTHKQNTYLIYANAKGMTSQVLRVVYD